MFFSEISFFSLIYPFLEGGGGGGKAQRLKKIYRPRAIFNIPAPPCIRYDFLVPVIKLSLLHRSCLRALPEFPGQPFLESSLTEIRGQWLELERVPSVCKSRGVLESGAGGDTEYHRPIIAVVNAGRRRPGAFKLQEAYPKASSNGA